MVQEYKQNKATATWFEKFNKLIRWKMIIKK